MKRDQNTFEFEDLNENSHYMIEIEVQFEKGGFQFSEKTLIKTLAKPISKVTVDAESPLDNDFDINNNLDISSSSSSSSLDVVNQPDLTNNLNNSSMIANTTSTTTPESILNSSFTTESMNFSSSKVSTESINRADIDFDPISNNEDNLVNVTDKQLINNEINSEANKTSMKSELPSLLFNITENMLDDLKPNKKLNEEDSKNNLNLFIKTINYENDKTATNSSQAANATTVDKLSDDEIQRNLIEIKIDSKLNSTKIEQVTELRNQLSNQGLNNLDHQIENDVKSNQYLISILIANSTAATTEKTFIDKPVPSNEIIIDDKTSKANEKTSSTVDNDSLNNELNKRHEESMVDNQNSNYSIDKFNEFKRPFLKRLDKDQIVHNVLENEQQVITNQDNQTLDILRKEESSAVKNDSINDLKREEDRFVNNLNQQDKQLESKLDLFDRVHNQTASTSTESSLFSNLSSTIANQILTIPSSTTSTTIHPFTNQELAIDSVNIQNRINQILNRNVTKDSLLPNLNEFEVTPLNGSTVNCKWKTNTLNENLTFTVYYNPIRYLEMNYSKNFDYDDEFLFLRTTGNEVNITNLLPNTIYDFYITINFKSSDNDEDFFYQLNKFLTKKLRNKFYVKHRTAFNQTDKLPSKHQSLTKTQKKYEKQFRALESVIDEFENLLAFFKGRRVRIRTLEELPSAPVEFTGIALDANSVSNLKKKMIY